MWKNWWDSSVWTEYVWRAEVLYVKLERRVDVLKVFTVPVSN